MRANPLLISLVLASAPMLVACVGAPPPPPGGDGSGSSSGMPDSTGLEPVTTAPVEDTSGTAAATGTGSSGGDTSTDTSSSSGGTTMGVEPTSSSSDGEGSGSSSTGAASKCMVPADCPNNESCTAMGECESVCAATGWGPNDYTYCVTPLGTFDSATICGEPMTCIVGNTGDGIETAVCGRSCTTPCDCPAPPATGDAIVSCGSLLGDGIDRCYLSCASGETCPDGMSCQVDAGGDPQYCTHPVQPIEPYGNCDGFAVDCVAGSTCATSGSNSVCTPVCPMGAEAECPAAPPGGELDCGTAISPPNGNDCHLDCVMSSDCPEGMSCVTATSTLCMWP